MFRTKKRVSPRDLYEVFFWEKSHLPHASNQLDPENRAEKEQVQPQANKLPIRGDGQRATTQ
jgi:hypothetical protein